MSAGLGVVNLWGFSPALDLQSVDGGLEAHLAGRPVDDPVNILCVGAGDCRHVLKTLAHARRHPNGDTRPIHIYVVESAAELVARQLLQLRIALERPEVLGLQEKAETFLVGQRVQLPWEAMPLQAVLSFCILCWFPSLSA